MQTAARATPEPDEHRIQLVGTCETRCELVNLIRCPKCRKMLAKCSARGMIEIACPRCKTLVRSAFI